MIPHPLNPIALFLAGWNWRATSGRAIYWAAMGWLQLPSLILVGMYQSVPWHSAGRIAAFSFIVLAGFAATGHIVRRIRDIGWHGAWGLVSIIPGLGLIFMLVIGVKRPGTARPPGRSLVLGYSAMGLFSAGLLMFALKSGSFWIPSGSMKPNLLIGDFVIALRSDDVAPGDIIVFKHSKTGAAFVKRLIAMGGDVVTFDGQVPSVNGTPWAHRPMPDFIEPFRRASPLFPNYPVCRDPARLDDPCVKFQWVETQPSGPEYPILTLSDQPRDQKSTHFQIPPGHVFVMGDNRDNSNDSRVASPLWGVGMVPAENIEFRVEFILVNFLSFDRWFKRIP